MASTRTGSFPIGLRRGGGPWQRDLAGVIRFAVEHGFEALDVEALPVEELHQITAAGLRIGSVDLPNDRSGGLQWTDLVSPDAAKRSGSAQAHAQYVRSAAAAGARNFLAVVIPKEHGRAREENFAFAVDGYSQLARAIEGSGARLVIEGWPGAWPYFSSLACTPAEYRAFLAAVGSPALGINFDPSHLLRMRIDPARFAREFGSRIHHVHAKDTLFLEEGMYEHGNLQRSAVGKPHAFGGLSWRYAIPGGGAVPWATVLAALKEAKYDGVVSVEMEDEDFAGTEEAEKRGLCEAIRFLRGA